MIIDAHAHLVAPESLYGYFTMLRATGGAFGRNPPNISDETLAAAAEKQRKDYRQRRHRYAIDIVAPVCHESFAKASARGALVARGGQQHDRAHCENASQALPRVAGLPQVSGESVKVCLGELNRCVNELGFVGCLVNPDPGEGDGKTPSLGDEYWYPLWEKLVALDIPGHIHAVGCYNGREAYDEHFSAEETLAIVAISRSRVFDDFPKLKLMVSHGGGAVPFQIGRWRAGHVRHAKALGLSAESFDEILRKFWFDTVVYTKDPLELLFKTVGADRCLFGTEKPGSGSAIDPETGRSFDDLRPVIESITSLMEADKTAIFSGNARTVFSRIDSVV
ncbi:MAG: amidohydrolase family protein [Candidatus Binataceae bacterium]